jgi:hypothetical protein
VEGGNACCRIGGGSRRYVICGQSCQVKLENQTVFPDEAILVLPGRALL